ncbi:Protein YIF1B-B [Halotydeus destructor]|nr:Protein YIF1B-B [Halotydeus destructor]
MDMSGAGRRQPRRHQQQQQQPASNAYETPFSSTGGYFNDPYDFSQNQAGAAMFDQSSSSAYGGQPDAYYGNQSPYGQPAPQVAGDGQQPFPNYFVPGQQPGNFDQNQFLLQAGSQMLQNQAMGFVNQYANTISDKGKSWLGGTMKYYFAVDTSYVMKKLMLLWFPFAQKDWTMKYNADQPISPRDDLNAPDLYIPAMAYVTYILVAGYMLGLNGNFSPEKLGMSASSALGWLLLEVVVVLVGLYLSSITCCLGFFHLMAYSGYKFVGIIGALLAGMLFNDTAYYGVLAYACFSLGFFLLRSLHVAIQTTSLMQGHSSPKNGLHIVAAVCIFNAFVMYWHTRHLVGLPAAALVNQ